ncbi:hypothetical protein L9F63_015020, partial [Diploptera punctata]
EMYLVETIAHVQQIYDVSIICQPDSGPVASVVQQQWPEMVALIHSPAVCDKVLECAKHRANRNSSS